MNAPDDFEYDNLPRATCNLQLTHGALPCDAYHHYYHYQSSAQYTLLARILFALGEDKDAMLAVEKALFQDHFNDEALAIKAHNGAEGVRFSYGKHPALDAEFRASLGKTPDAAGRLHDSAVLVMQERKYGPASLLLQTAIALSPDHGNSHFALGKCRFMQNAYEEARRHVCEAVRLSHSAHDAYHRAASGEHVKRGRHFLAGGQRDLAINAFNKALDLYRGNEEAIAARAQAYALRE